MNGTVKILDLHNSSRGWEVAGNAAMAGLGFAPALGHLGGAVLKKLDGPINLGGSGCFVAGTLVRINSLPLSSQCSDAVATLAGLRQPLALATVSADRHPYEQADAIHPSSFPAQPSVVPIESVPTGSRVGAINPQSWDYDDTFPEPDPYSWSRIDLVVSKDDDTIVDVELLRPDQWILDHDLFVGAELPIEVTELKVHGVAVVTALHACPPIAAGEGEVVTGRFATRTVRETVLITLADGTQLEGTPVHPIWSVDREDFVPMSDLQPGERLQTATGALAIRDIEFRHVPVPVFNIEVRGQHVYEVTELGILVHNAKNIVCGIGNLGPISALERLDPRGVRFSQDTGSPFFSTGGYFSDAVNALRRNPSGVDKFPPIRVVDYKNKLYSLDNRRLSVFKAAQVDSIPVQRLSLSDPAVHKEFFKKFKPINDGNLLIIVQKADRSAARKLLREFGKYDSN